MYCGNCGKNLNNGDKFCGHCGAPVNNEGSRRSNPPRTPRLNSHSHALKYGICILAVLGFIFWRYNAMEPSSYPTELTYNIEHHSKISDNKDNITCPLCKGSKKNTYKGITADCYLCQGKGTLTMERYNYAKNTSDKCPWCQGGGYDINGSLCPLCNGKGRLTILEYAFRMYGEPSTPTTPPTSPATHDKNGCPHCQVKGVGHVAGNGVCAICKGTGRTSGYGVQLSPCQQCDQIINGKGNGKCKFCHGTGWQ